MTLHSIHDIDHASGIFYFVGGGQLQHQKGTEIVLIPQPNENDPNDPLNWPTWKRHAAFWSVLVFAGLANFCVTGLAPAFRPLGMQFHLTEFQLTWLISITSLGMILGCFTVAPFASKFGKRPVFLVSASVFFACNIWAASSKSYMSLLLARLFAIWSAGCSEPLSMDIIKDLFFLHERGFQSGVLGMAFILFSTLPPLVCGFLIETRGWPWYHWLVSIIAGVDLVCIIFFVPETRYKRNLHALDEAAVPVENVDVTPPSKEDLEPHMSHLEQQQAFGSVVAKSYMQQLKPWSGTDPDSLLYAFIRPYLFLAFPAMIWTILSFAIHVASFIVIVTITPIVLSSPPYLFTISQQGLTFIGAIIGSVLGGPICGRLVDYLAKHLAKRNGGVFNPEMRLPITVFPMVITAVGLLMFGIGIGKGMHWIVPVIGSGFAAAGLSAIPSILQPYLLDSYYATSLDVFIMFHGGKNLIVFAVAFGIVPWIHMNGIAAVFGILAALIIVIDLG
ncbi:hypothetical protein V502_01948 [Pseudogymnoascus sp. VKM F-4520 (FW-2644)]|nr:hypothetical protein V502_01948 [Pseudogymnoascus sp. VKM F-4520 (FW-2644)]